MQLSFQTKMTNQSFFFLLFFLPSSPRITNDSQYNRPIEQPANKCCKSLGALTTHQKSLLVSGASPLSLDHIENHFIIVSLSLFVFSSTLVVECQTRINDGSSFLLLLSHW